MARKVLRRWWLWTPLLFIVMIGLGLALRRSRPDELSALRPYIVSDRISYMRPDPLPKSFGVKFRNVVLKGVSMDEFVAALDAKAAKEGGWWPKARTGRFEYFMYQNAKGSFNVWRSPTIQAMATPKGFKHKAIPSEALRDCSIQLVESWPLTKWEALWVRVKSFGRSPWS